MEAAPRSALWKTNFLVVFVRTRVERLIRVRVARRPGDRLQFACEGAACAADLKLAQLHGEPGEAGERRRRARKALQRSSVREAAGTPLCLRPSFVGRPAPALALALARSLIAAQPLPGLLRDKRLAHFLG